MLVCCVQATCVGRSIRGQIFDRALQTLVQMELVSNAFSACVRDIASGLIRGLVYTDQKASEKACEQKELSWQAFHTPDHVHELYLSEG